MGIPVRKQSCPPLGAGSGEQQALLAAREMARVVFGSGCCQGEAKELQRELLPKQQPCSGEGAPLGAARGHGTAAVQGEPRTGGAPPSRKDQLSPRTAPSCTRLHALGASEVTLLRGWVRNGARWGPALCGVGWLGARCCGGDAGRGTSRRESSQETRRDLALPSPRAARQASCLQAWRMGRSCVYSSKKRDLSPRKQTLLCANAAVWQVCSCAGNFEPKGRGWFHFEVSFSVRGGIWKLSCFPNLEPVFLQAAEHGRGVQGFLLSLPCGQAGLDGATVTVPLPFLCRALPSWG